VAGRDVVVGGNCTMRELQGAAGQTTPASVCARSDLGGLVPATDRLRRGDAELDSRGGSAFVRPAR
jgi:hypothetical protein